MIAWWIAVTTAAMADPPPVSVTNVKTAPEWEGKFAGKQGWIGADGVYSAVFGSERVLWFFGDTILGTVKAGRRVDSTMVNNTVGVQTGSGTDTAIRFVWGRGRDGKPAALFTPADGKGWFWPLAPVRVRKRLLLFLTHIEKTGSDGPFGFRTLGQVLAVIDNPEEEPEKWQVRQLPIPFSSPVHGWGSAALVKDNDLYIYGCEESTIRVLPTKYLTVARVPCDRVEDFTAWRFRTHSGWSATAADAARLTFGIANEFTVSCRPGAGYMLVCSENGMSERIVARLAPEPAGPWSSPLLVYKCPEMGYDKGVFCYSAKAHGLAGTKNEWLVSYCVNAWNFGRLFEDEKVYRPKFVRVRLEPAK